jgi:hypothetical protein
MPSRARSARKGKRASAQDVLLSQLTDGLAGRRPLDSLLADTLGCPVLSHASDTLQKALHADRGASPTDRILPGAGWILPP